MYRWFRNIHLLLGLFSLLFILMYGVSAIQMTHSGWFSLKPSVSERQVPVSPENAFAARALARELMDKYGMRGELVAVKQGPDGMSFRITRPGTVYEVSHARGGNGARVRTSTAGFMGMLNRIHHVAGLWHGYRLINVWGLFVGLISLAMLGMGATGIYMWFKIYTERRVGSLLLGAGLLYGVAMLVLMRVA